MKLTTSTRGHLYRFLLKQFGQDPTGLSVIEMVRAVYRVKTSRQGAWKLLLKEFAKAHPNVTLIMPTTAAKAPKAPKPKGVRPMTSDQFYGSKEWRALRFVVLKAANGCCSLCGRSNRVHGVVLHVDHVKPRSKHPQLALVRSNLQVLCEDCNLGKSNRDDTDWRVATAADRELDDVDWRAV